MFAKIENEMYNDCDFSWQYSQTIYLINSERTLMPKECVLCGLPITSKNDSKEHLIPNAIGGRKKVAGFICKNCNSKGGQDWDSELARQLNPLSVLFGISRERGEVPAHTIETANGKQLRLNADGSMGLTKPKYDVTPHKSGISINIHARSNKEAKQMLTGMKQKFPHFDIDEIMNNAQSQSYYPDGMINLKLPSFGGHMAGRSIVKTCLALAVESGVNPSSCNISKDYVTKPNGKACFDYYYERDLVVNRTEGTIFHCVSVFGNPDTKQLIGYVEYYSVWRMIVCLSDKYEGARMARTYALNPVSGEEIKMEVDLSSLAPGDIAALFRRERMSYDSVKKAFEKVMPVAIKQSQQKELNRVVNEAVQYAFKKCGAKKGEMLTEEYIKKFTPLYMEKITPFIIHQLKIPKK
ncbi:MAG: HNH endonuclease [Phycisphaerae bacterium]